MIIYRHKVIEALRTEPLEQGAFFGWSASANLNDCNVCAVGAVLRKHLGVRRSQNIAHRDAMGEASMLTYDQMHGVKLLRELSDFFEEVLPKRSSGRATKADRVKLIKFVKENFPGKFEIETDLDKL